jgi:hypothetical protein
MLQWSEWRERQEQYIEKKFEHKHQTILTLNLSTSSILAVLPSLTHDWKKLGATDTPSASDVMPVWARSALLAMTRKVPNNNTNKR